MRVLSGGLMAAALLMGLVSPVSAQALTFDLENNSVLAIIELYMKAADQDDWGPNMVAGDPLENGEIGTTKLWEDTCLYDLAYVMERGRTNYAYAVDLCDVGTLKVYDQ